MRVIDRQILVGCDQKWQCKVRRDQGQNESCKGGTLRVESRADYRSGLEFRRMDGIWAAEEQFFAVEMGEEND